jgi:alkaline phosphatase D
MKSYMLILLLALVSLVSSLSAQTLQLGDIRKENATQDIYVNANLKPFYHGVASGDPLPTSVILWTRVTPDDTLATTASGTWAIYRDLALTQQVQNGSFSTDQQRDFTVKLNIQNLSPGTYYYYQFETNGQKSIIGRTKTTDTGSVSNLRFAALSCTDIRTGYFTALGKIADRNDIDLVMHTGDYIYEQGGSGAVRAHEPNAEIYRIQDYRTRLSQYRLDEDLQRCHQMYPWAIIWDDHDIVVDALRDTSLRHNASFGTYYARKKAAIQAAREWLPLRDPDTTVNFFKNWMKLPYGNLADVYKIDARLYDRDRFATSVNDTIYGKPYHKFLGPEQHQWFTSSLAQSTARWKIVDNGLELAQFRILGQIGILENWDGYPNERNRFFDTLQYNGVNNVVFLTGDFHCAFASDVARDPYSTSVYTPSTGAGSLCVEFVAPSATAENLNEGGFMGINDPNLIRSLISGSNPHTKYINLVDHGYILLDINANRAQAEYYYMADILNRNNRTENLGAIWMTEHAQNRLKNGGTTPSPSKTGIPPAPSYPTATEATLGNPVLMDLAPNPARSFARLNLVLPKPAIVEIALYDLQGRVIQQVLPTSQSAPGNYKLDFDLTNVPTGIYIVRCSSGEWTQSRRLVVQH